MNTFNKFTIGCLSLAVSFSAYAADGLKRQDHSFVEKAAKSGMEEVGISKIAAERAQDPQIKEFAQMMVADHSAANQELMALAMAKNVALPADKTDTKKWSERSAKDFDQEYVEKMLSDHKDAVELFEKEAKEGTDPELKAFAGKTLPALLSHLDKVKTLKKMVK